MENNQNKQNRNIVESDYTNIHPIDNYNCIEMKILLKDMSNILNKNGNVYLNGLVEYQIVKMRVEENCPMNDYRQYDSKYGYNNHLERYEKKEGDSDNCKFFKELYNGCKKRMNCITPYNRIKDWINERCGK